MPRYIDNGGSTAEIVRHLGGPAIGDIRSRLLRLSASASLEEQAVARLLQYRLRKKHGSSQQQRKINESSDGEHYQECPCRVEFCRIVEGNHPLWSDDISDPYKIIIRRYLLEFHTSILKQSCFVKQKLWGFNYEFNQASNEDHQAKVFNYENLSIGNAFFTGCRLDMKSLEAAVFMYRSIAGIAKESHVVPVINLDERNIRGSVTLGAQLEDGTTIVGQNNISHPHPCALDSSSTKKQSNENVHEHMQGNSTGCKQAEASSLIVDKSNTPSLGSRIDKVYYINDYGQQIQPHAGAAALRHIFSRHTIVYAQGSLYTSIIPCLIPKGIGQAIASKESANKVLILNGWLGRETEHFTACKFVHAVTDALNEDFSCRDHTRDNTQRGTHSLQPRSFVTHLLVPDGGEIPIDRRKVEAMGIKVVTVPSRTQAEAPTSPIHTSTHSHSASLGAFTLGESATALLSHNKAAAAAPAAATAVTRDACSKTSPHGQRRFYREECLVAVLEQICANNM